jgi:hypothetical protein
MEYGHLVSFSSITKGGNIWRDLVIAARLVQVYQAF